MLRLVADDPWLTPFAELLEDRQRRFHDRCDALAETGGLLGTISQGHRTFGFQRGDDATLIYREWAPQATALFLTGDFNGWDRRSHPLTRREFGVWEMILPRAAIPADSRLKVHVISAMGAQDRIPAYARRVVQDDRTKDFAATLWLAPETVGVRTAPPTTPGGLRIYEAHVGMSGEEADVSRFGAFTKNVLPRIAALGYNAVQLMAVQEHPYYGSFGYHVSSFYAVSSRFGTPEDLRALIDRAHELGLRVLMDIVHSHAVKNVAEGLDRFDGTRWQYFHDGPRGEHPAWDSLLFDYGAWEVQRFLLSNARYWLEEYGFDGFRFDGVTSMIYRDHGLERDFAGYPDYFNDNIDEDAVQYLQLANALVHALRPDAVTIAEDMSGMPGMARAIADGGLGFDYRLAMGVPDYWIKTLKERRDEDWDVGQLFHMLLNRRRGEKHVGYAESHDQALVGDKTLAFRLMDAAMYTDMALDHDNPVVARGIALHKLIRLLTFSLAGEAWLGFMGNEFGHPEWIDFPREGNGWSYQHARRQWSLADDERLRYAGLNRFDAALMALDARFSLLPDPLIEGLWLDDDRKVLVYRRGPLVFAVNLHPTESYPDLRLPVPDPTDYIRVLDTDAPSFAGPGRLSGDGKHIWEPSPLHGRAQSIRLYLPCRCGIVLAPDP
jgi:1,4-alpha-glucan branching enzyme